MIVIVSGVGMATVLKKKVDIFHRRNFTEYVGRRRASRRAVPALAGTARSYKSNTNFVMYSVSVEDVGMITL